MLIVGLLVLLGVGGYYVFSNRANTVDEQVGQPTASVTEIPTGATSTDSSTTGEVKIIDVEAGSFYFKPNELRVKKGEKIKLTLKAVSLMHDFVIDELNVKVPVTYEGKTATVEFTPDKAGRFEYYCSIGNHRKNGQVGTLIVE